jgi:hypothetical protein
MITWLDLYDGKKGYYESQVYDLSSDFEAYITANVNCDYNNNDGTTTIEVQVSYDGGTSWTDWFDINLLPYELSKTNNNPRNVKLKYKVTLDNSKGGTSPVFKSIRIDAIGAFKITNTGDVVCKPELWIRKKNGSGTVRLTNETNGMTLELTDLNDGEEVYIDCENEDIISSLPLTYRYNNHNNVFLELEVGENLITGEGDFELDMRFEFKTLQG